MDSKAPPSAGIYDVLGWFETNKKRVGIGAAVVAIVVLVVGFWVWRSGQQLIEAEEALASVRVPFSPLEPSEPGAANALVKISQDYSGSPAAAKALLRAGTVYFAEGNYAKAREQFDAYLRSPGETPWIPQAVFGVAASLDAENKVQEAIDKYKDFTERYSGDPSVDQARLNLARLYERNNQGQQALEVLSKLMSSGSMSAQEAQERIKGLLAKYPSLAPTNPAPLPRTDRPLILNPDTPAPPVQTPNVSITPSTNAPTNAAPRILLNPNRPTQVPLAPPQTPTPGAANPTPAPVPGK